MGLLERDVIGFRETKVTQAALLAVCITGVVVAGGVAVPLIFGDDDPSSSEPAVAEQPDSTPTTSIDVPVVSNEGENALFLDENGDQLPFRASQVEELRPVFGNLLDEVVFLERSDDSTRPLEIDVSDQATGIEGSCRGYLMQVPAEKLNDRIMRETFLLEHVDDRVQFSESDNRTFPLTIVEPNLFQGLSNREYADFWISTMNQLAFEDTMFNWFTKGFDPVQEFFFMPSCDLGLGR